MNEIFNYNKLYQAYLACRKNKRKTINALKFEIEFEHNLQLLLTELKDRKYKPGRSICFVVTRPVSREIFAADFRDRIVHHLLISEILPAGERNFIFDSYACRENKGTHRAVERLEKFKRQVTKNHQKNAFYAQLDIKGFFMAIDQRILFSLVEKLVLKQNRANQWKQDVLWLAKVIIFHSPTENYMTKGKYSLFDLIPAHKSLRSQPKGKGLPIGNYSSQFFANLYLNELDQFIKRKLKCRFYVRYVDDLVLLDKNKEKLKYLRDRINSFLKEKLSLELNLNKTRIQSINKGIDFLGYFMATPYGVAHIKPDYALVRQKVVKRLKNNLSCVNLVDVNKLNAQDYLKKNLAMINSYYGHFRHAQSFNLRKDIYLNHLGELRGVFLPKEGFTFLRIKKHYGRE